MSVANSPILALLVFALLGMAIDRGHIKSMFGKDTDCIF